MKARVAASKGVAFSKSPVLAVRLPNWRSRVVLFVLFVAFAALAGRAIWLGAVTDHFLQKQGEARYAFTQDLPAVRGKILDRNGQVLASSTPVKAVLAFPEDARKAAPEKLKELAKLLEMTDEELAKKLESVRTTYLRRQVEPEIAKKVEELDIDGIETRKEYKRFYPQGEVATHVVGFTNVEDKGQESIELSMQKVLAGQPGSRRVIRDRLGRIVEDIGSIKEPHDGKDVTLALDSKLQYIAFTQVKEAVEKYHAKAGGAIVLDVHTGEILALANWPSYNPNDRSKLTGEQLRNRVLTDTFEPGSTLKPLTVALALDKGRVTPDTVYDTAPGRIVIGDKTVRDSHAHGLLTVAQIIQKSSNVGMAKISLPMPSQDMWEMFTKVGFGQQPKIGFPGAVAGRVRPFKSWRPIEQANMAFGQGISVSLVQLARSYMIYARDGDMIPLSFLKVDEKPQGTQVISPKTAAQMRAMLETVVSPEGTAPQAQVPGYRVGGKTGTAQKVINGRYSQSHYIGSFAGIVPMSNPRFVIAVMVDDPIGPIHTGGGVAAPTFALLAANALRAANVPPDSSVTNIIIPANSNEEAF
ncbi:penicillin-binding protein 2 [Massilia arenosa]|uniref:Peptidoglycan D,D-transpeptidase FtsI n=1 Tax=Zemynaea arenosa TaxID=2561931 RepID=A0A4Y9SD80_9BURK|nr:penicillin-binding protein 2 [Massilia arenosa]TFW18439.1 penicillin-binding protein 2 [Massilia arenosa]